MRTFFSCGALAVCVWAAGTSPAAALDWTKYVEFRDAEDPTTVMDCTVKAWTDDEKSRVLEILRSFPDTGEGLIQRAAAFKPMRFYRCADPKVNMPGRVAGTLYAWSKQLSYGSYFNDGFFPADLRTDREFLRWTLFHEIVHLADIGPLGLSESREWAALVDDRIKQTRANVAALPDSRKSADYFLAAARAGMPSYYASVDRSEALAEYATAYLIEKSPSRAENFEFPPEIRTFLKNHLFAVPYTPDRSYALVYEGGNLGERQKKFDEAIAKANEAIQLNPKNLHAYYLRGLAYWGQNKNQEAIDDLEKTLSLYETDGPYRVAIHKHLGQLYARLKDDIRSIEHLRLAAATRDPEALGMLADALVRTKQFDEAIEVMNKLVAMVPATNKLGRADALLFRAGIKLDKPDPAAAQVDLDAVVALDPNNAAIYARRGFFWKARGKHEEFERDFAKAIELAPKDMSLYRARGDARQARGAHREAIADYDVLLAANARDLSVLQLRGKSRLAIGDYDGAAADAEAVLKVFPKPVADAVQLRADARIGAGKREQCLAELDALIAKYPTADMWSKMRADAVKRLDEFDKKKAANAGAPASVVATNSPLQAGGANQDESGFVSLFDGRTLDGWLGPAEGYAVENGVLVCTAYGNKNLLSKKEYSDFVLRFDFKLGPQANNGIAIRCPLNLEQDLRFDGIEIQLLDMDAPRNVQLNALQQHGAVYGVVPAKQGFLKPVGEWNSQEIMAAGSHIKIVLNGQTILDADVAEVSAGGCPDGKEHPGLKNKRGHIGFLGLSGRIEFRNIRIKDSLEPVAVANKTDTAVTAKPGDMITNSIGMKLALIPTGEFLMGSPDGDADAKDDEKPQHRVRITKPFYMGIHEVTQAQWQVVMGSTPWKGLNFVKEGTDYPATYVSWDDTQEFCRKLSAKEGKTYGLPTEARWEYACRAGTLTRYSFGADDSQLGDHAWWGGVVGDGNAKDEKYAHAVGTKRPNPWGLYDMHGNVWEWCNDWYDANYYGKSPGDDPSGLTSGSHRVLRGSSWYNPPVDCRSAMRLRDTPGDGNYALGFRVVCEIGPHPSAATAVSLAVTTASPAVSMPASTAATTTKPASTPQVTPPAKPAVEKLPSDKCILELTIPAGATVTMDGKNIGDQRHFEWNALPAGTSYVSQLRVRFADGGEARRAVLIRGGLKATLLINAADRIVWAYWPDKLENADLFTINNDGSGAKRITDYPGPETLPALSPDGTTVAYLGDGAKAYLIDVDGSNPRLLTPNSPTSYQGYLAWSPDGTQIALTGWNKDGPSSVYVVDVATGRMQNLNLEKADTPHWSPDGDRLLLTRSRPSDRNSDVIVVDADGGSPKPIAVGNYPTWSPDGLRIAFVRTRWEYVEVLKSTKPRDDLFVINPDGSGERLIAENISGQPRWSPDGTRILIYQGDGVVVINADDGTRTTVAVEKSSRDSKVEWYEFLKAPCWSPDGTQIVYVRSRTPDVNFDDPNTDAAAFDLVFKVLWTRLEVVNVDGTGARVIADYEGVHATPTAAASPAYVVTTTTASPNVKGADEKTDDDTCVIDLTIPTGATVTMDGTDYGDRRRFEWNALPSGQSYVAKLLVRFPDGGEAGRTFRIRGGLKITLPIPAPDPVDVPTAAAAAPSSPNSVLIAYWEADELWYPVKVEKTEGDKYFVRYSDGVTEWKDKSLVEEIEMTVGARLYVNRQNRGPYYAGTVTAVNRGGLRIQYDDGSVEDTTTAAIRVNFHSPALLQVGARVFAYWEADGHWYSASILEVSGENYRVRFNDGVEEWRSGKQVSKYTVQVGERLGGNWQNRGLYYPATVTSRNGKQLHLRYDDGDEEDTTVDGVRLDLHVD